MSEWIKQLLRFWNKEYYVRLNWEHSGWTECTYLFVLSQCWQLFLSTAWQEIPEGLVDLIKHTARFYPPHQGISHYFMSFAIRLSWVVPGMSPAALSTVLPFLGVDPLLPSRASLFKAGLPISWHVGFKDCQRLIKYVCSLGFCHLGLP